MTFHHETLAIVSGVLILLSSCREGTAPTERAAAPTPAFVETEWPQVEFPGAGSFERVVVLNEYTHYSAPIEFRGSNAELIVYPHSGMTTITDEQFKQLQSRFEAFQASLDPALLDLPAQLRAECAKYRIDLGDVTDQTIRQDIRWVNVKLESGGNIECYTSNSLVYFDIVLGFSPDMKLQYLHFDG
jgi:hypothetical protein